MISGINKVIKIIVSIDFVINSAFGSFGPVFAIFLTDRIAGGGAQVAGFATAAYWVTKSILQLPIARFLDRTDGERDDFFALFFGYVAASAAILLFVFARTPLHIYLIQGFLGAAMSFVVPAWYGIFTRHIDKGHTSFEWSVESVFSVGMATSLSGALGGIIVTKFGFAALFIGASALSFLGSLCILFLYPHMSSKHIPSSINLAQIKMRQKPNL